MVQLDISYDLLSIIWCDCEIPFQTLIFKSFLAFSILAILWKSN